MKILAIGDITGTAGCRFLREKLPGLKKREGIDLVIANGENSADGNGITPSSAATTRIAISVIWAPRARIAVKAS